MHPEIERRMWIRAIDLCFREAVGDFGGAFDEEAAWFYALWLEVLGD